jgi:hypothetical protein
MISIPFQVGFSPNRWQQAIQVMLEKQVGFPLIHRLRVIQLLEADMNLAFRLLWGRRLVQHALKHNVTSPWQFGNRPGISVHSPLLLKVLSYDYLRHTRHAAIIFNNDAKACYDRIVPSLGLMASERFGMSRPAAQCMLSTIKTMRFYVQTAYGVSTSSFSTISSFLMILGVLQGSGAAPCIWFCLSCVLLSAIQPYTPAFSAICPRSLLTSLRPGKSFVDDTDLWLSSPTIPGHALVPSMLKVAQHSTLGETTFCKRRSTCT